jgi:peroxin-12
MFLSGLNADVDAASHPSFFEVIAQQYFVPSLEPASEYVWAVLAQRGQQPWVTLHRYCDELFYGCLGVLDWYFITHYNGTFSENFYGLHRINAADKTALSTRKKLLSVALTLGASYYRTKLPAWLSHAFEGSSFVFQLLYLYNRTVYFTPLLALERVRLVRLSPDDLAAHEKLSLLSRQSLLSLFPRSRLWRILMRLLFALMDAAQFGLPVAVFVFRFIEWWLSDENTALKRTRDRLPPPPPPAPVEPTMMELQEQPKQCPLCNQRRTNTATTPAGYCCCYPCLFKYISVHQACPVSGMPCTVEQIIKIYEE